jgi:hypothetical protein
VPPHSTSNTPQTQTHIEVSARRHALAHRRALKKGAKLRIEVARTVWLAAYVELGSVGKACEYLGIGRRTFYNWKAADPEFAAAVLDAEQDAVDSAVSELYRRAKKRSDTALIFYLKTHRPEIYGDKRGPSTVVVNQSQTNVGALNTDSFTDDQLSKGQEFIRRLREAVAKMPDKPEGTTGG